MLERFLTTNKALAAAEDVFDRPERRNSLASLEFSVPQEFMHTKGFPSTLKLSVFRSTQKTNGESEMSLIMDRYSGPPENPHMYSFSLGSLRYERKINGNGNLSESIGISFDHESVLDHQVYVERILEQFLNSKGALLLPQ
jgi:hypothetical protein